MRLYTCLNLFICWCKKRTYYIMSISDRMQNLNNTIRMTLFSLSIIAKIASLTRVYTTNLVISTWAITPTVIGTLFDSTTVRLCIITQAHTEALWEEIRKLYSIGYNL